MRTGYYEQAVIYQVPCFYDFESLLFLFLFEPLRKRKCVNVKREKLIYGGNFNYSKFMFYLNASFSTRSSSSVSKTGKLHHPENWETSE